MFPDILLEDSKLRRGPEIFALLRNFFNEEHRWTGVRGFFLIGDKEYPNNEKNRKNPYF